MNPEAAEQQDAGRCCENTDRHLWPQTSAPDAPYEALFVTADGGIGINIGGYVIVKPLREWHALANPPKQRPLGEPAPPSSKDETPLGYLHEITEPGRDSMRLFAASADNPWSHWTERHKATCVYKCTPLYARSVPETTPQPGTASVTLSADEFLALSSKEKELTEALAHADAINSESVNVRCHLEHSNRELVARVDRLRKRIHDAYDLLAAASSEDVMAADYAVKTSPDTET